MSLAVLAAALAGVSAAAALAPLLGRRRIERRRPRRRPPPAGLAVALVAHAGRALGSHAPPQGLAARIDAAGAPRGLTVADAMALKLGAALAGGVLGLTAGPLAPGRLGIALLVAAPGLGFVAPDLVLRRRARTRAAQLDAELADVADLLRVATDAGLAPMRALREVGRRHPGLLAEELGRAAARADLGAPRHEALAGLQRRAPTAGVRTLAAALTRSATHGAPLGPSLTALADDARAERARQLRDRAARAAPQIQLVVALLLVPAVLLLVAAALAASLL